MVKNIISCFLVAVLLLSCTKGSVDTSYIDNYDEEYPVDEFIGSWICNYSSLYDSIIIYSTSSYKEFVREVKKCRYAVCGPDSVYFVESSDTTYELINEGAVHVKKHEVDFYTKSNKCGNILFYENKDSLFNYNKALVFKRI